MPPSRRQPVSRRATGGTWWLRTASLFFSTMLALVVVEYGWRLLKFKRFTIEAGIDDPHFHHRLKPNQTYHFTSDEFDVTVRTNRYGLRGPDPVIPKPPGIVRILMLGDSFTFGFPVKDEETFCTLIEAGLKAKGYPVEVVNGGVSGYSPTLAYISLRDQFLSFEPDLVMFWLDRGDLQEDAWFQKNLLYDKTGRALRCDPRYTNGHFDRWEWLKRHSVIATYVDTKILRVFSYLRILGVREFVRTKLRGERAKVAVARAKAQQHSTDLAEWDRFLILRASSKEVVQPYWALTERYLLLMRDLLAERHIPFVMGTYPYGVSAGPNQWAKGRVYWGFEKGKLYEPRVAHELFKEFEQETGILRVSTLACFREAANTQQLYYDWDGHFTPAGHRVLAECALKNEGLLRIVRGVAEETRRARSSGGGGGQKPVDLRRHDEVIFGQAAEGVR